MSKEEEYTFCWNEYEQNFPRRFFQFLEKEEFIDVKLVAQGHLIGVHRIILSAISPYFHAMFRESQKTYVMLDNITKRSLEYLVVYIYTGKVGVDRRDLENFLRAAKFLRIQGIDDIDKKSNLNNSLPMPSNSIPNQQTEVVVKCETTECEDQNNVNSNDCHDVEEENSMDSSYTESFDDTFEDANWTPDSEESFAHDEEKEEERKIERAGGREEEESYCTCECPCPDETTINNEHNQSVCTNVTCPVVGRYNVANEELDFPPAKRARTDSSEFNIVADIRVSEKNIENLFYNGYKFTKNGSTKTGSTIWQCSLRSSNKCKAYVHTRMIDGVIMMKVARAEHTHPPNGEKDDIFDIVADIRKNDRNLENLYHNGYKFYKEMSNPTSTHWRCTMNSATKCKARAKTRSVNGVIMAKLPGQAQHTHPPNGEKDDIFDIVADIRMNDRNLENLYHDGYKFCRKKVNATSTNWLCTATKCNARAITRIVNGVIMAKLSGQAEHSHPSKAELDTSDFNIVADIRKNDRNSENLYHNGYRFYKQISNSTSTHWICTMHSAAKCKAKATTRKVNGTVMAKITGQEHNHERKKI